MPHANHVAIAGHLGRDPELRSVGAGGSVCNFVIAVSEKYRDAQGQMKESVAWVEVKSWGKTGESVAKYCSKGSAVFVVGTLKMDVWEDTATGSKRSKIYVRANHVNFLDSRPRNDDQPSRGGQQASPRPKQEPLIEDEEIPF